MDKITDFFAGKIVESEIEEINEEELTNKEK
jgi:hypothetical protein